MRFVFTLLFCITVSGFVNAQEMDQCDTCYINSYYEQKVSHHQLMPRTKNDIIFLGNSLMDIAEWAELLQDKRIKNRGISTDTSFGVLARLSHIVEGKPARIYLMIGINDIARNIPSAVSASNIEKIVKTIMQQSPATKIYVHSVLPTNNAFDEFKNYQNKTSAIRQLNKLIEDICQREKLPFIDLSEAMGGAAFVLKEEFTSDGLHLNGAGYEMWKSVLIEGKYCCQ